ncbi:DUF4194 domain-containing protein [Fodinicola acaciae]|uniref:DUF4194 domain-containing protein n=1 Tax=Fodinicola acaciae TaxID=2681555 RepID=UPI001C9E7391|nr:DUF4194 domain-containing protein [Fodinicola acaciae]
MNAEWDNEESSDVDGLDGADADQPGLPEDARRALVSLLRSRFVSRARQRQVWDALLAYEEEIRERLADLFLRLVIDRDLEVAFKRQEVEEDVPRLLRREKPLSRDASFVLLFLRQEYAYTDAADGPVVVNRSQVDEFLRAYREEGDGDGARFQSRVNAAIRALADLQLLTVDPDADYLFTVSPVVVPLIGVDEVLRLEAAYRRELDMVGSAPPDLENDRVEREA